MSSLFPQSVAKSLPNISGVEVTPMGAQAGGEKHTCISNVFDSNPNSSAGGAGNRFDPKPTGPSVPPGLDSMSGKPAANPATHGNATNRAMTAQPPRANKHEANPNQNQNLQPLHQQHQHLLPAQQYQYQQPSGTSKTSWNIKSVDAQALYLLIRLSYHAALSMRRCYASSYLYPSGMPLTAVRGGLPTVPNMPQYYPGFDLSQPQPQYMHPSYMPSVTAPTLTGNNIVDL
jgi:hypothetical protein